MAEIRKGPDELRTPRLVLRPPRPSDVDAVFSRYASRRPDLRFIGWPAHETTVETRAFLEFSDAEWRRWPAGPYLIWAASDGVLLGSTGLAFESAESASTGYVLARDSWGKGLATEALVAMVALARDLHVRRLSAVCHVSHLASQRVLEKAGFIREALLVDQAFPNLEPEAPREAFLYALTPDRT